MKEKVNKSKTPLLKKEEIEKRLKGLEEWKVSKDRDKIFINFKFENFDKSIYFINQVADFCKRIEHHPATIVVSSNKVKIELTTKKIGGLSKKDFVLAEKIDFIFGWEGKFINWLSSPKIIIILLILFLLMFLWRYVL